MFIISYPNIKSLFGGYGDRINGLIAIKILSDKFNHDFYIAWDKENIIEYFNYDKYNYNNITDDITEPSERYQFKCIDGITPLINHVNKIKLNDNNKFFSGKCYTFNLNSNACRRICGICNIKITNDEILHEYQNLYTNILKPKPNFLNRVKNIIKDNTNIIGIQIRCGDFYMKTNAREKHTTGIYNGIEKYLINIKKQCDDQICKDYKIFITSDADKAYETSIKVWNKDIVLYNHDIIQHLDRVPINDDISKVFIDSYILSSCTSRLYISLCSNYGRISALSCSHNEIYNINGVKISKNNMLKTVVP